ncbi:uncharacterized protein LOC126661809 [Mercurialis annua]|uniref:uncharacterized protein LOC126661809 n=1 Tax=Mercurialis annua TaxID=3986 RepID=UPI002160C43F|nr:uncharacterized protein LOC126661809 [Mercurialis annua]
MSTCLSSSFSSILVNGSPSKSFPLKKGVCQGDLISPYLFVLTAEGLKSILQKSTKMGLISGFTYSDMFDPVSVLQFADDTIFFLPFDFVQLRTLTCILRCFELISSLKINFHKSSLLGIHVSDSDMALAADIMGCRIESFPIKYLGLPLAMRRTPICIWDLVIQRFKSKLSLWKGTILSPTGRLVLLKSVLYSLPIYSMSILAMLIFLSNVGFVISNEESISLWHDGWSGNGSLVSIFPRLFQLSNMNQATVNTVMTWGWRWRWRRRLRLSQTAYFEELLLLFFLHARTTGSASAVGEDDVIWKHGSKGFSAASASTLISSTLFAHNNSAPMNNNRSALFVKYWKLQVPPRVMFLFWTALHKSLPSLLFLNTQEIIRDCISDCSLYGEMETQDHIFLHCIFARKIWYVMFQKLDIAWVLPYSLEKFFLQWIVIVPYSGCVSDMH